MEPHACVLVLPGGKVCSEQTSRRWQLANLRMMLVTRALRGRLGPGVEVRLVQYRHRGWNGPRRDALRDATKVLDGLRRRYEPKNIVLVGHSMGGRVAAHLCADPGVGAVVALAPWWPRDDGDLIPESTRLLVMHGTADTWTDPRSSATQTRRARERGVDATWVGVEGAGHYMLRRYGEWERRTTDFVADCVGGAR